MRLSKTLLVASLVLLFGVTIVHADGVKEETSEEETQAAEKQATERETVRQRKRETSGREDRSRRTSPYAGAPSYAVGSANEASRYRTDQGWSRGRSYGYWYGGSRRSDIPTTKYNTPRGR